MKCKNCKHEVEFMPFSIRNGFIGVVLFGKFIGYKKQRCRHVRHNKNGTSYSTRCYCCNCNNPVPDYEVD